jgi:paraquat-inducible protein B
MDPGKPGAPARFFEGLETPPTVTTHLEGRTFVLRAEKLGSISIGSPVMFRNIRVGEVEGHELDKDGQAVEIKIFVHSRYVNLVRKDSRFWNAGGVDVSLSANGIRMGSDSLMDMLMGGIAFESPISLVASDPAPEGQVFALFPSRDQLNERIYLNRQFYVVDFNESVRGLSRGAPVEFRGIQVGQVEDIQLELRTDKLEAHVPVLIAIEPERLRVKDPGKASVDSVIEGLVARGMRAQMKTGSLLTGALYVDLDFYPKAPSRALGRRGNYREIPTVPTTMGGLIDSLTRFLDRLHALPLEDLSTELRASMPALRRTLEGAEALVTRLDKETMPQAQATLEQARRTLATVDKLLNSDAPLPQDLRQALEEFTRTARAIRELAETLERHPESLLRGKGKER